MRPHDPRVPERGRLHMLVFDEAEVTVEAVRRLRREGFDVADVHSPFPLHGVDQALGLRPTYIALATLLGGLAGGLGKLGFAAWVHTVDWPMNIGGKSSLALPALIPVTFELTVLLAAFGTLGALFVRRRLYPRLVAAPAPQQPHPRVTDDRFAVLVVERDGAFAPDTFRHLCEALRPVEVVRDWRVG